MYVGRGPEGLRTLNDLCIMHQLSIGLCVYLGTKTTQ